MEISEEALEILNDNNVCQLATAGSNGIPNVCSTWFIYKNEKIYIATTLNTRKAKNILSNKHTSLVFLSKTNPYEQVLIQSENCNLIDDSDMSICDEISHKYIGRNFPRRTFPDRIALEIFIKKYRYHKVKL